MAVSDGSQVHHDGRVAYGAVGMHTIVPRHAHNSTGGWSQILARGECCMPCRMRDSAARLLCRSGG